MNNYLKTPSLGFSQFRELMDLWDHHCFVESKQKKIENLIDDSGLLLFFKFGKDLFGAPEESRIVFAKLKNEEDPGFEEEASFLAIDLAKALNSKEESCEKRFTYKDLPKIKIIDKEKAIKMLEK